MLNPIANACRASHPVVPPEDMRQGHAKLMSLLAEYDSMAPTINIGDAVIVDTSITWWAMDGVYLLNFPRQSDTIPATQVLRRVISVSPRDDRYRISCDNEYYDGVFEVSGEQLDIAGLAVQTYSSKLIGARK